MGVYLCFGEFLSPRFSKKKRGLCVTVRRPSVRLSVRPSVRPSVCPSVRPETVYQHLLLHY